jgi:hypothetical protein
VGGQCQADAAVLLIFPKGARHDGCTVEGDPIVLNLLVEDLEEDLLDVFLGRVTRAQEVEVARCPMGLPVQMVKSAAPFRMKVFACGEEAIL